MKSLIVGKTLLILYILPFKNVIKRPSTNLHSYADDTELYIAILDALLKSFFFSFNILHLTWMADKVFQLY